ncbi:MAG: glutamyl-tRNA amidotransferase [Actinobacteria bacterium]|nr:glutamyl-tRNA amidotransferase [Actinomycetota bacterium]
MALIDELSDALKEAMKAKDKPKLDAIRQVQTEIAKKKSEKGEEATDELVLGVISSYVKKMTKAVEEYKSLGDRGIEMAEKIQFEIDFLSGWLPEQLSEEDVAKLVDEVLADLGDVDMSQMGRVIGAVMAKGEGIDGSVVSKLVKEKLS